MASKLIHHSSISGCLNFFLLVCYLFKIGKKKKKRNVCVMIWKNKRTANCNVMDDTYVIKMYRGLWEQRGAPNSTWDNPGRLLRRGDA